MARYNGQVTDVRPIGSLQDLERLLRASYAAPVILFKHSETCGSSWMARALLVEGDLALPVHEIVVQRHRGLSDAAAARLGVRHESPQALVISAEAAAWHSSHAGVTADRVARALAAAMAAVPAPAPAP